MTILYKERITWGRKYINKGLHKAELDEKKIL